MDKGNLRSAGNLSSRSHENRPPNQKPATVQFASNENPAHPTHKHNLIDASKYQSTLKTQSSLDSATNILNTYRNNCRTNQAKQQPKPCLRPANSMAQLNLNLKGTTPLNLEKNKGSVNDLQLLSQRAPPSTSRDTERLHRPMSSYNLKFPNDSREELLKRPGTQQFSALAKKQRHEPTFDQILSSQYDKDMFQYKYKNPRCVKQEGKEQIHRFIYEKKKQNSLKYSAKSKINQTALPVPRGTISIMLNIEKKDFGFNLANFKKKIPYKSKFKMKWKTIQWLLNNKKDAIKQLFNNYSLMLKFAKGKENGMNRQEFGELLSYVGLGADENFANKLFYIFDDDNSQSVDYKEMMIGLETFKESSMDEKLKVFIELCDDDGNGKISQQELYNILKRNLYSLDEKLKLKEFIREIFYQFDRNRNQQLERHELLEAITKHSQLRYLLEQSIRNIKRVDQIIENDLEEPFHCWIPISTNYVNFKEGIHFKLIDKMINVVEQVEDSHQKRKQMRNLYKEAMQISKSSTRHQAVSNNPPEDNIDDILEDDYE